MASRLLWASFRVASHSAEPNELKYAVTHEWVRRIEDNKAIVGITDYAQEHLGDIVYTELPDVGRSVSQGETVGVIESMKVAIDINSPVSSKVLQVNNDLSKSPELVNAEPYNDGWIIRMELSDASEVDKLMNSDEYSKFCEVEDGNH